MRTLRNLGFTLALAVVSTAGFAQAQNRTWGFSKDTVYEWSQQSITLTNSGTDTLRIDSLVMELISAPSPYYEVMFFLETPQPGLCHLKSKQGVASFVCDPFWVAEGKMLRLYSFNVEEEIRILAKRQAVGDSLAVRLILIAGANRGRDTLVVRGVQQSPSALRSGGDPYATQKEVDARRFDLRGRRVEKPSDVIRIPSRAMF